MSKGWYVIPGAVALATLALVTGCAQTSERDNAPDAAAMFECLDGNGNGYLESGELQNTSACDAADSFAGRDLPESGLRRAEAMIERIDADGDSRISDIEFEAWVH